MEFTWCSFTGLWTKNPCFRQCLPAVGRPGGEGSDFSPGMGSFSYRLSIYLLITVDLTINDRDFSWFFIEYRGRRWDILICCSFDTLILDVSGKGENIPQIAIVRLENDDWPVDGVLSDKPRSPAYEPTRRQPTSSNGCCCCRSQLCCYTPLPYCSRLVWFSVGHWALFLCLWILNGRGLKDPTICLSMLAGCVDVTQSLTWHYLGLILWLDYCRC